MLFASLGKYVNMLDYQILCNYTALFKISLLLLSYTNTGVKSLTLLRLSTLNFIAPLIFQTSATIP